MNNGIPPKNMGYLHQRIIDELKRFRSKPLERDYEGNHNPDDRRSNHHQVSTDHQEPEVVPNTPGRLNRNRLAEMVQLGFGERSFVNPNSPYRSRVNGVTARLQASKENRVLQK